MAADKNNNTRRKVVANSNKLCRGTAANFASDGALQSIKDFGSFPATNTQTSSENHARKTKVLKAKIHLATLH